MEPIEQALAALERCRAAADRAKRAAQRASEALELAKETAATRCADTLDRIERAESNPRTVAPPKDGADSFQERPVQSFSSGTCFALPAHPPFGPRPQSGAPPR